jgi:HSP20 family protein
MGGRYPSLFLISRFQSEIDRLFEEALAMGDSDLPAVDWQPAIDIVETPDAILLLAEVPGLAAADLEVEVKGMRVTLSGTKPTPCVAKSPRFLRVERGSGRFFREVQLFWPVNTHAGSARLAEGLLTITFPRVEEKRQAACLLEIIEMNETETTETGTTVDAAAPARPGDEGN